MKTFDKLSRYKSLLTLIIKYANSELSSRLREDNPSLLDDETDLKEAKNLAEDLKARGPAYIKIGQFLSTQTQIIPTEYADVLASLQDNVSPIPFTDIVKTIKDEFLEDKANALIHGVNTAPMASASLAQVHEATLPTGRKVALKVQKPDVEEELIRDLEAFRKLAEYVDDYLSPVENFSFVDNFADFEKSLLRELDYKKEAQNLSILSEIFEEFDLLHIPSPIKRYSSKKVLTMEFVEGKKIEALSEEERKKFNGHKLADQLFHAYLKQILVCGFVHSDPHPGNVILRPDGTLSIIDAGMVAHLSRSTCEQLMKIVLAISDGRGGEAADCIVTLGEANSEFRRDRFKNQIASLVAEHAHLPIKQISPGSLILEINKYAREAGLILPTQFSILGQTLMKLDCVGKLLEPNFDPNKSIRKNSDALFKASTENELSLQRMLSKSIDLVKLAGEIPTQLEKILNKVAHNELEVKINAIDEQELLKGFQKIANRITSGLVISAMIIGAALLMHIETSWKILGYPGLAISFFILAAVLALYLLIGILWKDK